MVLAYLLATGAVVVFVGNQLGRELFPRVDTGQFQLRVRPPEGTHYELTRKVAQKTLDVIADEVGPENVEITMGYAGANPPQFTINMAYLWSRGPDDSLLRVGLREGSGIDIFALQERLRKVLPEKVGAWFRQELAHLGLNPEQIDRRLQDFIFAFEPGDLISQTMSLGPPRRSRWSSAGGTWPIPARSWTSFAPSSTGSPRSATCRSSSRSITRPCRSPSTASGPGSAA